MDIRRAIQADRRRRDSDGGPVSLTLTQQELINRMQDSGEAVTHQRGGFWSLPSVVRNARGIPEFWVPTRTVRALEARGLLERTGEFAEEWRDSRRLKEN